MERIFPNLYRFTDEPFRKGRKFSYLLVRKKGNLLLPFKGGAVRDHFEDIERLGGVEAQFVTHNHDVIRDFHEEVYDRFEAKLYYHKADDKKVSAKTKCPKVPFDDDGLQIDTDFWALYFPSCTAGLSIYWWRNRGKHYLFTSHVINMTEGEWYMGLDLNKAPPHLAPQFAKIAKLPLDYALPTRRAYGQEEFHRFNDYTRKSFATALRARIKAST